MAAARELTPKDYVELTNALAVSLRLLLLDRVWTREAQRASGASRDGTRVAELDAVTSEMATLFDEVQTCASSVTDIAEQTGTLLQERFDGAAHEDAAGAVSRRDERRRSPSASAIT